MSIFECCFLQVYKGIVELCVVRYRDSQALYIGVQETAYASLRAQLLMALHDAGSTELLAKEPCHKLAWTLDACLKVGQWLHISRYHKLSSQTVINVHLLIQNK